MPKPSQIGKCRLCLSDNVELRKSHFFPAACFKIIRQQAIRDGLQNPNPEIMNARSVFQSSLQPTANLLCHSCEQRLSANGESWVLRNCWRGITFPLQSMLFAGIPEQTAADVRIYWTSKIPEVNRAALAYFAASMFWRAAVHNWWSKRGDSPLTFGPYLEQLRQYLMGTANFPTDCALAVVISAIDSDATKIVQFIPATRRFRGCRVYVLHFLGIQFLLFVGKMFPQEYREMDFANGVGNPIIVTSRYERWMSLDLLQGYGRKRLLEMTARMKS